MIRGVYFTNDPVLFKATETLLNTKFNADSFLDTSEPIDFGFSTANSLKQNHLKISVMSDSNEKLSSQHWWSTGEQHKVIVVIRGIMGRYN